MANVSGTGDGGDGNLASAFRVLGGGYARYMQPNLRTTCPLCGRVRSDGGANSALNDTWTVSCEACGTYRITREAVMAVSQLTDKDRLHVSAFTFAQHANGQSPPTLLAKRPTRAEDGSAAIWIADALSLFPDRAAARCEQALLNVAALSPHIGAAIEFSAATWHPALLAETNGTANAILGHLEHRGLVRFDPHSDGAYVSLTLDGWDAVEEIRRGNAPVHARQAFVAMSFGGRFRDDCERGVTDGVEGAGYDPWVADREHFAGKIDDRIIAEIRRSAFVVADLTRHRHNVYFEAGFALGLGRTVIYTCFDEQIRRCRFDIRQFNVLPWTTADELAVRLTTRIEAVIGRPAEA